MSHELRLEARPTPRAAEPRLSPVLPSTRASAALRRCVRVALSHEQGLAPRWQWDPVLNAGDFLAAVQRQRVTEVLADNASHLELPYSVASCLVDRRNTGRLLSMAQVSGLAHVKEAMTDAGVRFLSVKGPALATQTTGDFTARGSGDIDILVAPSSVAAARDALVSHGWRPRERQPDNPGSWGWRHMLAAYYEMTLEGPRGTVDLHWRLDHTHAALPDFDALWGRRTPVTVGGQAVTTLAPRDAFVHACHHAAKDQWGWVRSLVDVHRLARSHELWEELPLDGTMIRTLLVTEALIGLPEAVPATVRRRISAASTRPVRQALQRQGAPAVTEDRFPGIATGRLIAQRLRSSHTAGGRPAHHEPGVAADAGRECSRHAARCPCGAPGDRSTSTTCDGKARAVAPAADAIARRSVSVGSGSSTRPARSPHEPCDRLLRL